MKILILGAGQVGTSVASALASENNDITVVDTDHQRLRELAEKLDIRTVVGHASLPSVLAQAGAEEAELLVAVGVSNRRTWSLVPAAALPAGCPGGGHRGHAAPPPSR